MQDNELLERQVNALNEVFIKGFIEFVEQYKRDRQHLIDKSKVMGGQAPPPTSTGTPPTSPVFSSGGEPRPGGYNISYLADQNNKDLGKAVRAALGFGGPGYMVVPRERVNELIASVQEYVKANPGNYDIKIVVF